eukprot:CAMPEP_0176183970 /NCGR_PEP_ID=MMETSP0121_2-20121125/565_1 /TAXON_ID=160619 /ORGANISM="Kryptoperidinium foliaceum, Strain CCMP 1326" /LENGTH=113 /DNA_ID=CAMNT_0017522313 /DNA_START=210 /DNA_END=548 /DNA_ORIENTATION=-
MDHWSMPLILWVHRASDDGRGVGALVDFLCAPHASRRCATARRPTNAASRAPSPTLRSAATPHISKCVFPAAAASFSATATEHHAAQLPLRHRQVRNLVLERAAEHRVDAPSA